MIKFISVDDVLTIRNQVLRGGKLMLAECRFPTDDLPGSFHLGNYIDDELACIASFHIQSYGQYSGTGYQLRGMATLPAYQGKGLGTQVMKYALDYLKQQYADYIWCNARKTAVDFYQKLGLSLVSPEFEVQGIGPHYVMYANLKQTV